MKNIAGTNYKLLITHLAFIAQVCNLKKHLGTL